MTELPETGWASSDEFPTRSTGLRLFAILLIALSPLALVAYIASEQIETNEQQAQKLAAASALNLGALRLNTQLDSQRAILLRAANTIALGGDSEILCADLRQELQPEMLGRVMVFSDLSGAPICGLNGPNSEVRNVMLAGSADDVLFTPDHDGLVVFWKGSMTASRAAAFYSTSDLVEIADPAGIMPLSHIELHADEDSIVLSQLPLRKNDYLGDFITAAQQVAGLNLTMRLPRPQKSSSQYLIRIIPIIMILAAAIIGWLVVNRMLMRPIRRLQNKMRAFKPGNAVQSMQPESMIAREIIELDGVFKRLATKVRDDKDALAHGLSEQVKLTREVHHRVKNNLQIITSLLSLHARGADSDEIARVYASIQRRVNALAVVHRHHFADTEASRGIALRELICEVVSSFRARDPQSDLDSRTTINMPPLLVDQDVAMPVAFLLTEILELIQTTGAQGDITVTVAPNENDGFADLSIVSPALEENPMIDAVLKGGVARIMLGLSRQLRTTLDQDRKQGRFSLTIRLFDTPASECHSNGSAPAAKESDNNSVQDQA